MKYNWSIIGHEKQLAQIEQDIKNGNLAHAYLLAGSNSVGKYTVARKLAGILQCKNDFCHKCNECLQVEKGSHVDTIEFRGKRESIKIAEIRKIIERLSMTRQARYKIMLIQSLERMTTEAANSFLKILEEPPPRTIFIMTTDNPGTILQTLLSRVRLVKFASVSSHYLHDKLKALYPDCDEATLEQVSLFSMGKSGKALSLMEKPEELANYVGIYHKVQNFLNHRSIVDRFAYVDELLGEEEGKGVRVDIFFAILVGVLRSKILESGVGQARGSYENRKYLKTLSKIEEAGMLLKKNVNSRLLLENLMLEL